jgi:hypothetical protein
MKQRITKKLDELPDGTEIYIDVNIFIYNITNHPLFGGRSKKFLKRTELGKIKASTSIVCLNELLHKLVLGEIAQKYEVSISKIPNLIKKQPDILDTLQSYDIVSKTQTMSNLFLIDLTPQIFSTARELMKRHYLLSNDAIHAATCKIHNIKNIATNDPDFERVPFLKVWKP